MTDLAQWQWAMVPGGEVWHAYPDDAPREQRAGYWRRRAACGVWRRATRQRATWTMTPDGPRCESCQALWDERYVYRP